MSKKITDNLSRKEIEELINNYILGRNAERDRMIMKRRLIDGITYENLAAEFKLSTIHVKEIVKKRQDRLFKELG